MLSQTPRMIIAVFGLSLTFAFSGISDPEKAQVAKPSAAQEALKAIQATRKSSFFNMQGGWRMRGTDGTPATYRIVPSSRKNILKIKNYYLIGNRATMVTDRYMAVVAVNPTTRKPVKFETTLVDREIWLKLDGKWFLKNVKSLSYGSLVDGKIPQFQ